MPEGSCEAEAIRRGEPERVRRLARDLDSMFEEIRGERGVLADIRRQVEELEQILRPPPKGRHLRLVQAVSDS